MSHLVAFNDLSLGLEVKYGGLIVQFSTDAYVSRVLDFTELFLLVSN